MNYDRQLKAIDIIHFDGNEIKISSNTASFTDFKPGLLQACVYGNMIMICLLYTSVRDIGLVNDILPRFLAAEILGEAVYPLVQLIPGDQHRFWISASIRRTRLSS